jgi:DNA-binding NarL/FixJ family response regulator
LEELEELFQGRRQFAAFPVDGRQWLGAAFLPLSKILQAEQNAPCFQPATARRVLFPICHSCDITASPLPVLMRGVGHRRTGGGLASVKLCSHRMIMNDNSAPATGTTTDPACTPNVRVWLVDDNNEIRKMVANLLGHQGGIECARHFSSPDALLSALASKPGPDVILLDVQMGDRNGLDAVRPIKSLTRSTRVLMFTTCNNPEWRERALSEGASDYLLKSSPLEQVARRIRCPADDPARTPRCRRRLNGPAEKSVPRQHVNPAADKSPLLLSRTLQLLRSLSN